MQQKKLYMNQVKTMITEMMMAKAPELKQAICDQVNAAPFRFRLAMAIKLLFRKFGV